MTDMPELLERAYDHVLDGRMGKAERALNRLEARDPDNSEAMFLRGLIAFRRQQFEAALGFVDAAVTADPSVARFHGFRARLLGLDGRMEDAREACWAAIRLKPDEAEYWIDLGAVLDRLGETEAAVDAGRCAVALKPGSARAHENLGTFRLALGWYDEALESALAAVEVSDEESADLHNLLCVIYEAREEDDLAEASARRSIELDPQQTDSMAVLARVLRRTGRDQEASNTSGVSSCSARPTGRAGDPPAARRAPHAGRQCARAGEGAEPPGRRADRGSRGRGAARRQGRGARPGARGSTQLCPRFRRPPANLTCPRSRSKPGRRIQQG